MKQSLIVMSCLVFVSCQGQASSSKAGGSSTKTTITSAKIQGGSLVISASYFAPSAVVTLGGTSLKITSAKTQELTATLPEALSAGSYLLSVSTGTPATSDTFTVCIGATGPPGPSGPAGSSAIFPPGYAILGESSTPPKGFVYSGFSVISQGGTIGWSLKAPSMTARTGACAAVVKGTLYVIGGTKDPTLQGLTTVEAYDPATDTWSAKAPIPTGRVEAGIGVINGSIYVVGGSPAKDTFTGAFDVYDPATNKWAAKAPIPTPKKGVVTAVVNNVLYVMGDFASFATPSAASVMGVEAYDPVTDAWTQKAALPSARTNFSVGVVNNMIYAIGGSADGPLALNEAYDPATNTWVTKAPMPGPRKGSSIGVVNGTLYVAGGRSDTELLGTAIAYDPLHDSWSAGVAIPIPVEAPAGCASDEGVLYLVGGATSAGKIIPSLQLFTPSGPKFYVYKSQ